MMSSSSLLLALAAVFSVAFAQTVTYNYQYFDASNKGDFQFNLDAVDNNNPPPGYLLLTKPVGSSAGTAFLKNSIPLQGPNGFKASFSTRFSFTIDQGFGNDGTGSGADGIVFIINAVSNNGGTYGGGIGYAGIARSVGIEFDTWYNPEFGDINGNHIGIDINGAINSVQQLSYPNLLNNGVTYYSWVDYNGDTQLLEVRIATTSTKPATPFMSRIVDLVSILGSPNVYVGFSAATGGSWNRHMINSWSFTNQYAPNSVCGNGIVEVGESCDGGSCCSATCAYTTSATICRAATGLCDVAEKCTGTSSTCPSDSFASSSVTCRSANGACDVAETCSGTSTSCPADSVRPSTFTCRSASGPCDVAETCTGSDVACPADSFATSDLVCRGAAGPCDAAETCSGSSGTCPADTFAGASVTCRSSNGPCDVAETCSGSSVQCPSDSFATSGVCRASTGVCDVAETCSGSSAACPADSFQSSSVTCRGSVGPCDVAETCTGSTGTCPDDSFAFSSVTCRSANGPCDLAESCTGESSECPADSFAASTVTCRNSAGVCDAAETCSGSSGQCPADAFAGSSVTCRPSNGPCDVAETCSGSGITCPSDSFASADVTCRASTGVCDISETCTGSSASCPSNSFASSSTECRASIGPCDPSESCTGASGTCPADVSGHFETACAGLTLNLDGQYSWLNYDVISFNGFVANTGDIEGRAAVRHNAQVGNGWSVGYGIHSLATDNTLPYSMITGDNFSFGSGSVYPDGRNSPYVGAEEDLFVGAAFNGPTYLADRVKGHCGAAGCLDSQFNAVQQCYGKYQSQLSRADNVAIEIKWSGLSVTCNSRSDSTYFLTLTPQQMTQYTYVMFDGCSSTARWVINIAGTDAVTFTGASFPAASGSVIYNVHGSGRQINVHDTNLNGNLLAPFNELHQTSGVITGKVIVNDVTMSLQMNRAQCFTPQ